MQEKRRESLLLQFHIETLSSDGRVSKNGRRTKLFAYKILNPQRIGIIWITYTYFVFSYFLSALMSYSFESSYSGSDHALDAQSTTLIAVIATDVSSQTESRGVSYHSTFNCLDRQFEFARTTSWWLICTIKLKVYHHQFIGMGSDSMELKFVVEIIAIICYQ